jgi:Signal transduction histidine kinase
MFSIISRFAKIGYVKWNLATKEGFAVKQWYDNWGETYDTSLDDIIGKYSKIHPDDRKPFDDFLNNLTTSKINNFKGDLRIKNKDGGWRWIHLSTIVSDPDPNNLELIGLNFDITNSKEAEQELIDAKNRAEAAGKLKMSFLANMSHEIRTPLNALVGFTDLLVNNGESFTKEEKKYYNSIIKENSYLLLRLINDILDLSKIEAGTLKFIYNDVEINSLLNDIKMVFENKIKEEVKLIIELKKKKCHIKTDKNRLYQILTNLITNAIKFTNKGYIKLSYYIHRTEILFTVEDTGEGIDKNELESIFTNFVKLNNFSQGSGLGLAICKNLVKQMNGKIGVDSTPGVGSKFWFTLPIVND